MTDASPYKFLDHFERGDGSIFFARERETRILVADVVVNRLVVLFAPTGTGKTSLINAGVRPRLEERGYATFFVRVRRDPEESARAELALAGHVLLPQDPLDVALRELSKALEQPIVLFFDQFEEFFLYVGAARRARFIESIALLHRDQASGVHVIFSMREEFFVEMDAFREKIPTIFHNDSNLRLRPFDRERAREALVNPAEAKGTRIETALVERVLDDLALDGLIEPAQLQIVADSLWQEHSGSEIKLADYHELAGDARGGNVAHALLGRRLEQQLSAIGSEQALKLIQRLLPELVTRQKNLRARTKCVRSIDELVELFGCGEEELRAVLAPLERLRFIRTVRTTSQTFIELTHDYLAERIDAFQASVRRVWPRRKLAEALQERGVNGALMSPEKLESVMLVADDLDLGAAELALLFRSATQAGVHAPQVFELARRGGIDLWPIVEELVDAADLGEASRATYLLGQLDDPRAEILAARAAAREALATEVINVLVFAERPWAVNVIERCADRPALATDVQRALARLTRARRPSVAAAAGEALKRLRSRMAVESPPAQTQAAPAGSLHSRVEQPPYDRIASLLRSGVVVPFLGAGASLGEHDESSPPTASRLARLLSEELGMPLDQADASSAQRLASYVEALTDRSRLDDLLDHAFRGAYEPRAIHRLLARLPAPLIVVTTNYDDLMEQAFAELGRPIDVLAAPGGATHGRGEWLFSQAGMQARRERGAGLRFALKERPVVVKLKGSVGRGREPGHYVVTEEDQLDQLTLGDERLLPEELLGWISSRSFLFLGHSLRDFSVRMMLRLLGAERPRRSFAVLRGLSPLDVSLWGQRKVDVYDQDVNQFAERLEQHGDFPRWTPAEQTTPPAERTAPREDTPSPALIYLSYSRRDREAARRLADHLSAHLISVFLDVAEIPGNERFQQAIDHAIDRAVLFVPLVSRAFLDDLRGYHRREVARATARAGTMTRPFIVPVLVDDVLPHDLPQELAIYHVFRAPGGVPDAQVAANLARMVAMIPRGS